MSNTTVVVPFQSGTQLYCFRLSGLEENTRYKLFILAANSVGASEPVVLKFRTAIHGGYMGIYSLMATGVVVLKG